MLSFSLLMALVLDRVVPVLQSLRPEHRFQSYTDWFLRQPLYRSIPPRFAPYVLILPPLILVAILGNIIQFSGLFELAFNTLIAFICLKPRVLNEEVDDIIKALDATETYLQRDIENIFNEANRNIFSMILWMVVAGPVWLVGYRLLVNLVVMSALPNREIWQKDINRIIAWIEWLPALTSSYVFMLCGSFEAGIKASQNMPLFGGNVIELNETRLRKIGFAVVEVTTPATAMLTVDIMRRVRGMLLRTLVVWLVLAAIIDYWL